MNKKLTQFLIGSVVLIAIGFGVKYWFQPKMVANADNDVAATNSDAVSDQLGLIPPSTQPTISNATAAQQTSNSKTPQNNDTTENDITGFDSLPEELQTEIRRLNSNDNDDIVVEQISPTIFRANLIGIHQHVPVAVVNDDGTVTIREY